MSRTIYYFVDVKGARAYLIISEQQVWAYNKEKKNIEPNFIYRA